MANKNDRAMKLIKEIFKDGDKIKITGNNPLQDVIGTIIHNDGTKEVQNFKSIPDFISTLLEELNEVPEDETSEAPESTEVPSCKKSEGTTKVSVNDMLKNEYKSQQADMIYKRLSKTIDDIVSILNDTSIKHEFCEGSDTVPAAVKLTIKPEINFSNKHEYSDYVCEGVKDICGFEYVSVSKASADGELTLYCVLK